MIAQRITANVKGFEERGPFVCVIPFPDDIDAVDEYLLNPIFEAALRQQTETQRQAPTPSYCITDREVVEWTGNTSNDGADD